MKSVFLPFAFLLFSTFSFGQSDPTLNMSLLANWAPDSVTQYNDIWGYMDCDGGEYAILGSKFKIHFLDVSVPTNPVEVANFAGGQGTTWRDIKTYRNRAYAVSDNTTEGMMIFDLSQLPAAVTKTYQDNSFFQKAHNVFVDEPNARLYVVGSPTGNMLIFDLSEDPDNPVLLSTVTLEGGYVHDLFVKDGIAYCSHLASGMYVYDCKDANNVITLGSVTDYLGTVFNHSGWLSEDGNSLVFCDETHGAAVKVADVSDLSDITVPVSRMFSSELEAPTATSSVAHNPLIRENYVFLSYYHDGVQVYDIENVDSIQRVAYFDTNTDNTNYNGYQGCWGVYPYLSSGTIIASDISKGLFVLSLDELELEPNFADILPNTDLEIVNGPMVCEGDSATLIAINNNTFTYTWKKDGEELIIQESKINVLTPGTYQVEINNGQCSSLSEEFVIEFTESPDLSMMTGDETNICENDEYIITGPEGLDGYLWMKNGNVVADSTNTFEVTESGTYTLLVSDGACSVFSPSYEVEVTVIPQSAITPAQDITCEGEVAQLLIAEGGDNYVWYKDGEIFETTTTASVNASEAGIYTVSIEVDNCEVTTDEFDLTFAPLPVNDISLSGSSTICEGGAVTLSANTNANEWNWMLDGNPFSTESSIEVNTPGYYELSLSSIDGCSASNQQWVNLSIPQIPTIVLQNDDLVSSEADLYQWHLNGQAIQNASTQFYTPLENGSYTVITTNGFGCTAISEVFEMTTVSTAAPKSLQKVSIFPNPVTSLLQIQIQSDLAKTLTLEVFNASGILIEKQSFEGASVLKTSLDLSEFTSGLYLVKLTNEDGSRVEKVVKK
ncbi:MAG: choice-of-anchor B family protein [Saprospiraceae bacterium]